MLSQRAIPSFVGGVSQVNFENLLDSNRSRLGCILLHYPRDAGGGVPGDFVIFPDPRPAAPPGGIYRGKGMFRVSVVVSAPALSLASDFAIHSDLAILSDSVIPSDFAIPSDPSPWPCDCRRHWCWAAPWGLCHFQKCQDFQRKYFGLRMTQTTDYFPTFLVTIFCQPKNHQLFKAGDFAFPRYT